MTNLAIIPVVADVQDYIHTTSTLNFLADGIQSVTIPIVVDQIPEPCEFFQVWLNFQSVSPQGVMVSPGQFTMAIVFIQDYQGELS